MLAPAIVPDWPQLSIKKGNSFHLAGAGPGINHRILGFCDAFLVSLGAA